MSNQLPLAKREEQTAPVVSIGQMLSAVIEKGVTSENADVIKKLAELSIQMEDRNAEKQFAAAFVELQAEMKNVVAMQSVPGRDGSVRYRFADYQTIMDQVAPLLKKHGFTVRFSTDFRENRMIKTCILQHTGGHEKSTTFAVRIGGGPPGCTESQADGAASTYAKRYALVDALNITTCDPDEDDARAEGAPITKEQAEELARRVNETESDRAKFLEVAGAPTFAEIPASKYDLLDSMLRKKEQRGR